MLSRIAALAVLSLAGYSSHAHAGAWTVNTSGDAADFNPGDGNCRTVMLQCSLRAAIMESNANGVSDTISIPAGTYTLTRSGSGENGASTGDLDITTGSISITGSGSVTIATSVSDRIFHVTNSGASLGLQNVTVSGGTAADGGSIYNNGGLTFRDVVVQNGAASNFGGGLFNDSGAVVALAAGTSVSFIYNSAVGHGGAIYNEGTVTIGASSSGTFDGNNTTGTSYADGGAIYNASTGVVSMNNVALTGNTAGVVGGAIYNEGTLTLDDATVSENDSAGYGGAICHHGGDLTVTDTLFELNTAVDDGGAIHLNSSGGSDSINRVTFDSNDAGYYGGAVLFSMGYAEVRNSTFVGNGARYGAAIAGSNYGSLDLVNSTVSGNTALIQGGGVYQRQWTTFEAYSSTITDNAAGNSGGGIAHLGGTASMTNTILAENTEGGPGHTPDCLGSITSTGYSLIGDTDGCTLTLTVGEVTGATSTFDVVNPDLDPLGNNGGTTDTHALSSAGGPAIDAGNPGGCRDSSGALINYDQRQFPNSRHVNTTSLPTARCDIGAYEY